ncbi:hypothetical protein DAPPUDRAFT_103920 [Daphnia pulex]|uniref:Uncharacterized protein n=1 Tax=Daphnia pulex TaxID=6669 RepID=E9GKS0_DAPPU|nr:hypothetical protein DAPPUDRAFT_103920 [Daphnia pulex]|eukprot:EFX79919.1 hypothetical protein DAPPUDRAFT_103920 [Daphnia pulex]
MKSFLWFVSVVLVLAAMTGFVFLTDADLFDLFNGSSHHQRSRWKRSRLYPQYVLPPDQDRQRFYQEEEEDRRNQGTNEHQHHPQISDDDNSLQSRIPTTVNQPYFESKLPPKTAAISMATYNKKKFNTERPIPSGSNHKVLREAQYHSEPITTTTMRTPFANNLSPAMTATAVAAINTENFNNMDVALKVSESKSKPSFTKMFQKAMGQRRGEKKSIREKFNKKKLKQELPRDYRHGGGGGYGGGGTTYHHQQPPVYYIPNHHKEKDFSGLLKLFLLAILIPLGICIALAVAAAFATGLSAYSRYLVTYVNSTNSTYYFINGFGGFANLFGFGGLSGLSGLIGSSSGSTAAVAAVQQQQQQQTSNNNNNNNNANANNNNNAIAVIVVNVTGRANKDNDFFRKPFKFKSTPIDQEEEEQEDRVIENF